MPESYVTVVPKDVGLVLENQWPGVYKSEVYVQGPHKTGVKCKSLWNSVLTDFCVYGPLGSEEEYTHPTAVDIGIDLSASMDMQIVRPRIMVAKIGIFSGAPDSPGRAEGLHIEGGWMQHVNTGVELVGEHDGGWPTPAQWIERMHLNHLTYGIRAFYCSGMHLNHNDMYASHYTSGQWGIYLIGCKNVEIVGNHFWTNRPGFYGGIVLDACENVHISGGVVDASVSIALHATRSCRNVTTEGATWVRAAAAGKVVNNAGQ